MVMFGKKKKEQPETPKVFTKLVIDPNKFYFCYCKIMIDITPPTLQYRVCLFVMDFLLKKNLINNQ